ncbi:MAG: cytochrome c oxidase subunit I [Acidimicrobiia bacterium]
MTTTAANPTIFRRPRPKKGFWSWITTVDHKRIGKLYGYTAFVFFILGGLEALLIRVQLSQAESTVITAAEYNALFTMHGTTMVFLVVMPLSAAFFNFLIPLMIGARDVAFPRLNALSYWIFLAGGIFLYSSFFLASAIGPIGGNLAEPTSTLGTAPSGGWFGYANQTSATYSSGTVIDYWALGLQILGLASLIASVNFITTIFNLRAKGMRLLRMPVFVWMSLVVNFLLLFALPIIAVALFMLIFDRQFGTLFFDPTAGGEPILWQHLFWLFGHPEVYILILPAMGIVSEVLPVYSRKPLFGYAAVVFAGVAIAFLGFGVWSHHMFASAIPPVAQAAFGISTMAIAVPTGIKIFNWLATMWGGRIRFKTPMLFAVGFVAMFVIGGLSGVTHAIVPADWQQTDTYYIVAHFHYVLFGGSIFGLFAGLYYWFPKMWGRNYSERLGKAHFWLMFIGFNVTFAPMHWLGLQGMVRRTWTYSADLGLGFWNAIATVGAFLIALSVLIFMYNWVVSKRRGPATSADPWDARTLEWSIPSPPPEFNFARIPVVHSLDAFWHQKYDEDEEGRPVRRPDADALIARLEEEGRNPPEPIHLPAPSVFPIMTAIGVPLVFYGIIYHEQGWGKLLIVLGALLMLGSLLAWSMEPLEEPEEEHLETHEAEPEQHDEKASELVEATDDSREET